MTHPRSGLVARVAQLTSAPGPSAGVPLQSRARLALGLALVAIVSASVSVRVAGAAAIKAQPGQRPDVAKLSQEMNALAARQVVLEAQLKKLSPAANDQASEPEASVRVLEIEQELRHTRQLQLWLEQRLANE
jgi:hypothetical protein